MSVTVEERLRVELARRAAATPISPTAREDILARSRRPEPVPPRRRRRGATPRPATGWRQPVLALAGVVVLVVVAVRVIDDGADGPQLPLPVVQPLPVRPPAIEGTVLGAVLAYDCSTDCGHGPAELDLARPSAPRVLAQPPSSGTPPPILRDGRRLRFDAGAGWQVVDSATGAAIALGSDRYTRVDALPDGRVVTFTSPDDDARHADLRILGLGGTAATTALPDGFWPDAVTAGPARWTALAGHRSGDCCLPTELVLVAPDATMRRIDIDHLLDGWRSSMSGYQLSWSSRGLIAVSGAELEPLFDGDDPLDWTLVVDPTTTPATPIARLDDWQGIAWSSDGTGLLAARRTSNTTADLRLFWGPGLAHHTDLAPMTSAFTPYWWAPTSGP